MVTKVALLCLAVLLVVENSAALTRKGRQNSVETRAVPNQLRPLRMFRIPATGSNTEDYILSIKTRSQVQSELQVSSLSTVGLLGYCWEHPRNNTVPLYESLVENNVDKRIHLYSLQWKDELSIPTRQAVVCHVFEQATDDTVLIYRYANPVTDVRYYSRAFAPVGFVVEKPLFYIYPNPAIPSPPELIPPPTTELPPPPPPTTTELPPSTELPTLPPPTTEEPVPPPTTEEGLPPTTEEPKH